MSELVEFLQARISEDEVIARATLATGAIRDGAGEPWSLSHMDEYGVICIEPTRVLAECEAKRRIIKLADDATSLDMQVDSGFRIGRRSEVAEPYVGDVILRSLAQPYRDHPDFKPEWTI